MRNITTFRTLWLASACPSAAAMPAKLRRGEAVFAQVPALGAEGSAVFGASARQAGHGTPAHLPVYLHRPMGDEQIRTAVRGGAQGPHYAWRGPVIP